MDLTTITFNNNCGWGGGGDFFCCWEKKEEPENKNDGSLLMLQQQLNQVAQAVDSKLSESNKNVQEQLSTQPI